MKANQSRILIATALISIAVCLPIILGVQHKLNPQALDLAYNKELLVSEKFRVNQLKIENDELVRLNATERVNQVSTQMLLERVSDMLDDYLVKGMEEE